jgi:hypothetical protein
MQSNKLFFPQNIVYIIKIINLKIINYMIILNYVILSIFNNLDL